MKTFRNAEYSQDIRRKIPGYDFMLQLIFQAVLPEVFAEETPGNVLGIASQKDELIGLSDCFGTVPVTVVEPSATMLDILRSHSSDWLCETEYVQTAFEETDLDKSYTLCLCLLVLQFTSNPKAFLTKIYEQLDKGGVAVLSIFSKDYLNFWAQMALANGTDAGQVHRTRDHQSELMTPLSSQQVEFWLETIGFSKIDRICQILSTTVWLIRK